MTTFNLEAASGVWWELEGGGRVQLRPMDPHTLRGIRRQATRVEYARVDGKAERFESIDADVHAELYWDHIIMAWEHLLDAQGTPIPCTKSTKVLLLARSELFARFVTTKLREMEEAEAARDEARLKN